MGAPILNGLDIPTTIDKPQVVAHPIEIEGVEFKVTCVSMGNPHCVVFVDDTDAIPLEQIGPKFEHAPFFPERVNTEFVQILGENALKMRVWERGSGETLACGTGACAAAVAAVLNGIASKNDEISVALRGGELNITVTDQTVFLRGGATTVFCGEIEI
jgi:diaminopimelate epimerase